jgi:hypothetical protein
LEDEGMTQRALGFGRPPSWEESTAFTEATASKTEPSDREFIKSDPTGLPAARAILALTALDHQIHEANTDSRLSPAGRTEKLAAPRVTTIKTIATAGRDIAAHGTTVAQRERDFYKPTPLPSGDVAAASEDRELRDHWKSAPVAKRTQMLSQMQAGQHDRMLGALTRSPIPLDAHEAELVNTAWCDSVAKRDPKQAAALQSSADNHQWADGVVKASAKYASRSSGLSPLEITSAAAGTGGEFLFDNIGNNAAAA